MPSVAVLPHWPEDATKAALPEGVQVFRLTNGKGLEASLTNYGATLLSVRSPSKKADKKEELTVNYQSNFEDFKTKARYYGPTVGRVANRIAGASFELDGETFTLAANNGPNALHGGVKGFDKLFWAAETFEKDREAGVTFSLVSPDGDEGYPGELSVTASYSINEENELKMVFSATVKDKATPVSLCNHAYWNLSGDCKSKILTQSLTLNCSHYLPVDATLIPTGEVKSVVETPFDFYSEGKQGKRVGEEIAAVTSATEGIFGYDHCLVRADAAEVVASGKRAPSVLPLSTIAVLEDPVSGRKMTVSTTQPAVQCYSGNFLSKDESNAPHTVHNSLCLETQGFPDAIHQPETFPDCVLRPGAKYEQTTIHRFEW